MPSERVARKLSVPLSVPPGTLARVNGQRIFPRGEMTRSLAPRGLCNYRAKSNMTQSSVPPGDVFPGGMYARPGAARRGGVGVGFLTTAITSFFGERELT